MKRRKVLPVVFALLVMLFHASACWADKSATAIEAPETAARGSEIVIRVTVTHSGNSFMHYTEWLWVKANDVTLGRWDYSSGDRPDGATFTKEIRYKVEGDVVIKAKAGCNIHGSAGESVKRISVK
jgi:desulfoferrodoxin (superoxide reductase-like protein)